MNNLTFFAKVKRSTIKKIPYIEICETVKGMDNKGPAIKAIRLLIRYLTRYFGYYFSSKILMILVILFDKWNSQSKKLRYILYLFKINKLRIEYLASLSRNELTVAVYKKNIWAETALKESFSRRARWNAKAYLSLLSRYGFAKIDTDDFQCNIRKRINKKFYLYGPNAKIQPSSLYNDYTLVLMKPIKIENDCYQEKILFLNSVYYRNVVGNNKDIKKDLIEEYNKIYVSCREVVLEEPFVRSKFPLGDNLAAAMALGRVLYNLANSYGKFTCVIEGFDFYLESIPYGLYYPSLTRNKNNTLNEQVICSGLADHDALYNFLYVKYLVSNLDVIDSSDFKRIIEYTGEDYLDALSKARNFKSLRNL